MTKIFFEELNLPDPVINLNIGSGTHAEQTAKIMIFLEKILQERQDKKNARGNHARVQAQ
jgi:UDP-N-acetylglucosamine 2-epimerase (non-hydrolysing)